MDCLVTGGAGFIGSHLVDALIDRGDNVTVLDDLSTGRRENLRRALEHGAKLRLGDIRDPAAVCSAFEFAQPEIVFHLAARVDVRFSVQRPVDDLKTNVAGTINVLEAARAADSRRIVNSSTGGGLYGEADVLPTPEDHPIRPLAPYGQGKHSSEGYCEMYARLHGLSTVSLRYANVYGPRQASHLEGGVVAIFCDGLVSGRKPTIYGDGRQTRDWVEVSDVVRANLLAADSRVTDPMNIGWGQENSVLDLVAALNEVSGGGGLEDLEFAAERPGEVRRSCLDWSRARGELGWEPGVELHAGLRRVLASM